MSQHLKPLSEEQHGSCKGSVSSQAETGTGRTHGFYFLTLQQAWEDRGEPASSKMPGVRLPRQLRLKLCDISFIFLFGSDFKGSLVFFSETVSVPSSVFEGARQMYPRDKNSYMGGKKV